MLATLSYSVASMTVAWSHLIALWGHQTIIPMPGILVSSLTALKFDKQIDSVMEDCYFQLMSTVKLKSNPLSLSGIKTVNIVLISSWLDYCN